MAWFVNGRSKQREKGGDDFEPFGLDTAIQINTAWVGNVSGLVCPAMQILGIKSTKTIQLLKTLLRKQAKIVLIVRARVTIHPSYAQSPCNL